MEIEKPLEIPVRNADQLGNALKRFRKQETWPQLQAGERAGIHQKIVSSIESGTAGTRIGTLFKLLAALDLELVIRKRKKAKNPFEARPT